MITTRIIHFHGASGTGLALIAAVNAELRARPADSMSAVVHEPITLPGADPLPVDQDARLLMCQVSGTLADVTAERLDALARGFAGVRAVSHQRMSIERITPGAPDEPGAKPEAVSWIVQYNGPAEDPPAFHAYYRSHHVPIVHRMPGIRSLNLYSPEPWTGTARLHKVNHLLIVQAVFDNLDGLLAMRNSPQRREGLQDFDNYPKFEGPVTHQAMRSHRIPL